MDCSTAEMDYVRILNMTQHRVANVMWLTLEAGASVGVTKKEYLMLREDKAVKQLIEQGSIKVLFND